MRLYTPAHLAYPVTVTTLLCKQGDDIAQNAPIFGYKYRAVQKVYDDETREDVDKEVDFFTNFESAVEGNITGLTIEVGQVLCGRTQVADIEEPCKHEVQYGGICANCGKDMTVIQYNQTTSNAQRATINTVHGHTALLVSEEEATRADDEAKRRLLDSRKLSLVVDLDQTVIQATVDPTIAEWQQDDSSPNHDAVKDVRKFQLVDEGPGGRGTWYYIKLRPGLHEFLQTISKHYEMHIYTMATRAYADQIANLIDPDHKLFASRILSRDESGSMNAKDLKRLFPMDTKMVVIIDDRGDVWKWSQNLVKVSPYDFFVGIGDINSSFLPKRPELEKAPAKPKKLYISGSSEPAASETKGDDEERVKADKVSAAPPAIVHINGEASAVDRMVSMAGDQDEDALKEKTKEQDETIAEQLADRPLLQKQKLLEAAEEEAKASPAVEAAVELLSENGERKEVHEMPKYRHNLLQDDDTELEFLGQALLNIHNAYFDEYEKQNSGLKGGRIAELKPGHSKKRSIGQLEKIPDAAEVMTRMKMRVLAGVHIVFSGVVPLGVDIHCHDIAIWAKSFGATVSESITKRTTHVIGSPERRTAKVRQAAKKGGRIAIVNQNWLFACVSQWRRVDENPYRIHCNAPHNGCSPKLPDSFEGKGFVLSSSEEEAAQTEDETDATTSETPEATPTVLEMDTDVEAELQRYSPTTERRNSEPIVGEQAEDWMAIMGEVDEFVGSEAEESESESVWGGRAEGRTPPSQKRKRDAVAEEGDEVEDEYGGEGETRLQKRKKEAMARTSSLTNVANALSPAHAEFDPGGGDDRSVGEEQDFDLEAALTAEMERQSEEDTAA